eukprot:CAMPEP_0194039114 /NCGR_PEP_ID=MMETSP0009_2-20130614/11289_1 /TAXON_ID=210454 /ORGANISM="Grammatophora oceanica, Strain CCMP 410" /LENGTH=275 /DNA_ID=CAMNT_0038681851 /DNA_START=431 /DNA_END=1258 /DNA_ORIENTATION=+
MKSKEEDGCPWDDFCVYALHDAPETKQTSKKPEESPYGRLRTLIPDDAASTSSRRSVSSKKSDATQKSNTSTGSKSGQKPTQSQCVTSKGKVKLRGRSISKKSGRTKNRGLDAEIVFKRADSWVDEAIVSSSLLTNQDPDLCRHNEESRWFRLGPQPEPTIGDKMERALDSIFLPAPVREGRADSPPKNISRTFRKSSSSKANVSDDLALDKSFSFLSAMVESDSKPKTTRKKSWWSSSSQQSKNENFRIITSESREGGATRRGRSPTPRRRYGL